MILNLIVADAAVGAGAAVAVVATAAVDPEVAPLEVAASARTWAGPAVVSWRQWCGRHLLGVVAPASSYCKYGSAEPFAEQDAFDQPHATSLACGRRGDYFCGPACPYDEPCWTSRSCAADYRHCCSGLSSRCD